MYPSFLVEDSHEHGYNLVVAIPVSLDQVPGGVWGAIWFVRALVLTVVTEEVFRRWMHRSNVVGPKPRWWVRLKFRAAFECGFGRGKPE